MLSNTPAESFRRAITIPFFDDMISHLNNRFSDVERKTIMALSIVSSVFMTDQEADASLEEEFIDHCHDDLPSPSTLQQELHMSKCKWKLVEKKADYKIHLQSHLNLQMSSCFQTFIYFCT